MKILLLSAYDARSHQYWHEGLRAHFVQHQWTVLSLPARHFLWRIRGNALAWARDQADILSADYDLCMATSMVDLATLKGLNRKFAKIPCILYFHENQFAYPGSAHEKKYKNVEPMLVQMYSALAADTLCFNSQFNRETFLSGLKKMLQRLPDYAPQDIVDELEQNSRVLSVPIKATNSPNYPKKSNSFVWNHRWEYDKGPIRLLAFLRSLPQHLRITVHVIGQSFRQVPKEFDQIKSLLEERAWLGQWGYVEDHRQYETLLQESQYVLSTAEHDFQGLSILEAVARGCIPILPNRLAYREFFPETYLYSENSDPSTEAQYMTETALRLMENPAIEAPSVSRFSIGTLGDEYQSLFELAAKYQDK